MIIIPRLIPVLLLKNRGLVKSIKFKDFTYIGDPINAVKIFNEKEVDEICLLDIDATRQNKEPDYKLIEEIGSEAFIPFGYGGGIKNLDQAKRIFKLGAEKIILNTAAIENSKLISEISDYVGSQSVVVSIDIKKNLWGKYTVYSHLTKKSISADPVEFLKKLVGLGAGEIILNNVDNDGLMQGMDTKLIKQLTELSDVPLVAIGGAANLNHVKEAVLSGAAAVAAGSMFVFHGKHKAVLINYPSRTELNKLYL
jgi:imidazole glycerol-phosphate synthase subunit HisF